MACTLTLVHIDACIHTCIYNVCPYMCVEKYGFLMTESKLHDDGSPTFINKSHFSYVGVPIMYTVVS